MAASAASSDDVPSDVELGRLEGEWQSLEKEVGVLKQRLETTEQNKEGKKLKKDHDLKVVKMKLAEAKYWKAASLYDQRQLEKEKAKQLQSGLDVTVDDEEIRWYKERVVKCDEDIKQLQQQLLKMEQEEELMRNKQLLKERLKQGSVKMRYLVCITIGLPGVGKTCLKYLLMGEPPPELCFSTILSESPIRIEVSVQKISQMKVRASGEQWRKVTDSEILDIVGGLIILASEQHPNSMEFLGKEASEAVVRKAVLNPTTATPKVSLLQRFLNLVSKRKPADRASYQKVSVHSSEACRKAVDTIMGRLVDVINRLKNCSGSSEPAFKFLSSDHQNAPGPRSDWVLFSDCGGQPKYHELLPLFLQHISAALCVLRLTDNLDKVQPVEYYNEGKPLCLSAQSQFSAKDTIKCLVNTVLSFSTQNQKPKVIFVGTHLDEFQKKERDLQKQMSSISESPTHTKSHEYLETLQEKNDALIHMLESEFSDHLMYYSDNMKQLLYPVNTMKRGEEELRMAKLIREAVEKSPAQEAEVPVWWLIFEMLLQELAKLLERKVLSKAECLELACTLGFGARELEAVLVYFDNINVIRYSPKVLPNVIFTESQVPLEKVSEYIKKSYILHGEAATEYTPTEGKLKYFRDHGVISRELMSEFRLHYVEGIFKEEDLAALLVERLIFAPIPTPPWALPPPDDEHSQNDLQTSDIPQLPTHTDTTSPEEPPKESYYFMASSLMTLTEAELKQHRHSSPSVATLLVKFPKGQRRAGVFCCFASYVICQWGWDIILDAKVPLYRNCIKFHPKTVSPPVTVTVIDSDSFIEVHANISEAATDAECACLLPNLKSAVFDGITAACVILKYQRTHPELGFFCPHHAASEHSLHSASIRPNRLYWCCDVDTTVSDRLEKRHHLWFRMIPDPQLLADAHASLPPTVNQPQDLAQQQAFATATSTSLALPTTTDQPPVQSSENIATSHSRLPAHSSMSSSDHGHGAHLPDQYSILQSITTAFSHAWPSTSSSGAHLPEIPHIRYIACQPATSQQTQQNLPTTVISTGPSHNLSSSNMQPSCLSSEYTVPAISAPASQVYSAQLLAADTVPRMSDYDSVKRDVAIEPTITARKPALHELDLLKGSKKTIRIIERIAHRWRRVAIRLHFETHHIEGIEQDCYYQTSDASRKVMMKWLDGGSSLRKPITWATLIKALEEADLSEVAKDIVSILQESDV